MTNGDRPLTSRDRTALRGSLDRVRSSLYRPPNEALARSPRRVGVLGFAGVGGSGKVAAETAQGLARLGHDVTYFTGPDRAFAPDAVRVEQVPMPREPVAATSTWVTRLAEAMAEHLRACALDLIFVHYVTGNLESVLRARCLAAVPTKVVAVLHGSDITRFGRIDPQGQRMRDALACADEVVAVSSWLAHQATERLTLARDIRVIDNAVDVERFRPSVWSGAVRARYAPEDALLLGHVSNLRPVKRAADVLETVVRLREEGLDARGLIIGDGPELSALKARAGGEDLAGRVAFAGAVPPNQLPALMAACDIMLITSSSESFSLAAMESMACGVPVVSTRCGGLERAMNHLVPVGGVAPVTVGSPSELAQGVRALWPDRARYDALAAAGLRMAIEEFPQARQLAAYAELVEHA